MMLAGRHELCGHALRVLAFKPPETLRTGLTGTTIAEGLLDGAEVCTTVSGVSVSIVSIVPAGDLRGFDVLILAGQL